jgi:hypothetical protein
LNVLPTRCRCLSLLLGAAAAASSPPPAEPGDVEATSCAAALRFLLAASAMALM